MMPFGMMGSRRASGSGAPAPSISALDVTASGATTAQIEVSVSPAGGTLHWYISTSSTPPSIASIKSGAGSVDFGSFSVLAIPTASSGPSGLTASTNYWAHAVYTTGSDSTIATDAFTTEAADVTAPVLSAPSATVTGETTASGAVSTDEGRGTLYWVATTSATAPSAAQVRAGQDHTGAAAVADGSQAVTTTGPQSVAVTGLSGDTAYYIHFCQEDVAGNVAVRRLSHQRLRRQSAGWYCCI